MTENKHTSVVMSIPDLLQFEMLITDIVAGFLGMGPEDVDGVVDVVLEKIRVFFDSNWGLVVDKLHITHQ